MTVSRAVPIVAIPSVILAVCFAAAGFVLQVLFEFQGGFIIGFPVTGWLQDVLGPGGLEGVILGSIVGGILLYRRRKSARGSGETMDTSARAWISRHRALTAFALMLAIPFLAWRIWWIFFSGMYMGDFTTFAQSFERTEAVVIYEGLPRQWDDQKAFDAELAKPNVEIHGFRFYREPKALNGADWGALRQIFQWRGKFSSQPNMKLCGGFHPDYCLEWHERRGVFQMQFCLGCGELKCFGAGKSLSCDMRWGTHNELKLILEKYGKPRSD